MNFDIQTLLDNAVDVTPRAFVVVDRASGAILATGTAPLHMVAAQAPEGCDAKVVDEAPADPTNMYWSNGKCVRREPTVPFAQMKVDAAAKVDIDYAARINLEIGTLGALYTLKRAQAEAGGGPLIVDEADRLAVLAAAAEQDARVALLDNERRTLKREILAVRSKADLAAILASQN